MANETGTAAKSEAKTQAKASAKDKPSSEAKTPAKAEAKDATASDAEPGKEPGSSTSDAPKGYNRGENQKSVTDDYRKNWDNIFGKKPRRTSRT